MPPPASPPPPTQNKSQKTLSKQQTKKAENNTSNIISNITILQLSDEQIDELRDPTNDVQTFRLTEKDKSGSKIPPICSVKKSGGGVSLKQIFYDYRLYCLKSY